MRYYQAVDIIGLCTACGEHTSLAEACCGEPIWFEGGTLSPDTVYQNQTEHGFGLRFVRGVHRPIRGRASQLRVLSEAKRSGNPWSDPIEEARAKLAELRALPKPRLP